MGGLVAIGLAGCTSGGQPIPRATPVVRLALATPTPTVTPAPTPSPSPSPIAAAGDGSIQVLDLSFADTQHGAALASSCAQSCRAVVFTTADGGRSWSTRRQLNAEPAFFATPRDSGEAGVRHVLMATARDGWAYQPSLLATHDGGATWTAVPADGDVVSVAAAGGSIWRVVRRCMSAGFCPIQLESSPVGRDAWRAISLPPGTAALSAQLVRPTAADAWIVLRQNGQPPTPLLVTHNGGASWQSSTLPCDAQGTASGVESPLLSAADSQHLWAACQGEPGAGEAMKSVVASNDGGRTWLTVAENTGTSATGSVPITGYLVGFTATSARTGWLALERETLFGSHDGGRTWRRASVDATFIEATVNVVFRGVDGWTAATGLQLSDGSIVPSAILRTVDGGAHWTVVPLRG